jgi:hypothetical protein
MCANFACIAAVLLGIDAGWQPLPDGGMLYMIQIEPHLLETLASGEPIQSDVPSFVKNVRAYRIMVGTAELPRELPAEQIESPAAAATTGDQPPTDPFLPPATAPPNWPDPSAGLPWLRQPGAESPVTPNVIEPAPNSKRIDAQTAGYLEGPSAQSKPEPKSPSEQAAGQEEPQQDQTEELWTPLVVALFTLFGSLGANLYLGWVTWNTRSRYRSLIEDRSYSELE